jgi:NNP family nitrate/nitrite transporter-like MFS transporter
MYWTFIGSVICTFLLSYPATTYIVNGIRGPIEFSIAIGFIPFTILTFILGFFMSLGKAAVYKHIPVYYPGRVGSVGGVVGLIGGLGGFVLPIVFGMMNDLIGVWTSCFMLLFVIASASLLWMHAAIRRMEKQRAPELAGPQYLPESDILGRILPTREVIGGNAAKDSHPAASREKPETKAAAE